jgi:dipicolinate synthase subunit A
VKLSEIVKIAAFHRCGFILGGMIPDEIKKLGEERGVEVIDFYLSEDLQMKNALPSAEGALMLAMEHTDITISGMRTLICGYGRIGKILCTLLSSLGASVTVAARRDEVLHEVERLGYDSVRLGESGSQLARAADRSDVIFNTIPERIFEDHVIYRMENKPLYIEIASLPGGIDAMRARERGIKLLFAPSLPGKYAPVSAGMYIFETIADILKTKGVTL